MRTHTPNHIAVSDNLLTAIDRLAKQLGISRSALVRKALERYLEQECEKLPVPAVAGRSHDEDW